VIHTQNGGKSEEGGTKGRKRGFSSECANKNGEGSDTPRRAPETAFRKKGKRLGGRGGDGRAAKGRVRPMPIPPVQLKGQGEGVWYINSKPNKSRIGEFCPTRPARRGEDT